MTQTDEQNGDVEVFSGSDAPTSDKTTSEADSDFSDIHSLWVRWTDVRSDRVRNHVDDLPVPLVDVHLHRYCDLLPFDSHENKVNVEFRFVRGIPRTILRFTPLFTILVCASLIVYAEWTDRIVGISSFLPPISMGILAALGGGAIIWALIVYLTGRVGLIDERELLKAVVVWGLILGLLAGSLYSVYLVLSADSPSALPNHVVFVSGYLLVLLVGGLGVYDGALRTETMLEYLHTGRENVVNNQGSYTEEGSGAYTNWKRDLQQRLDDRLWGIPTSHIFAVLFVLQFMAIWIVQNGPQNLNSPVLLIINVVADIVLVIIAFRFLILIRYINMLMTDQYAPDGENEIRILTYQPFHYDRRGGFQDLGRFATRVNLLLLVGGLYTVYRLYVQGLRALPAEGLLHFETNIQLILWGGNFILPILAYGVAAGAWVYYSFWAIHRKMVMDKRMLSADHQGIRGGEEPLPTVGDSFEDFEDGIDWYYLQTAPEWPINSRYIVSIVSANVVPLLLPLLRLM